jgi:UPF0716 protein FxsA
MPVLLILVVAVVVELAVLIAVGKAVGVLATIGLLVLGSLVGGALLRREGSRTMAAFNEAVRTRRPPHRELVDGVLIAAAGVLIVLPGFVSDVLGLLLLLPPTRMLVRRRMLRSAAKRSPLQFTPGGLSGGADGRSAGSGYGPGEVIDGEVVDGPVFDDTEARNTEPRNAQARTTGPTTSGPTTSGPGTGNGTVIDGEVVEEHDRPASPGERS